MFVLYLCRYDVYADECVSTTSAAAQRKFRRRSPFHAFNNFSQQRRSVHRPPVEILSDVSIHNRPVTYYCVVKLRVYL